MDANLVRTATCAAVLVLPFTLAACTQTGADAESAAEVPDFTGAMDDPYRSLALEVEASADEIIALSEALRSDIVGLEVTGPARLRDPFALESDGPEVITCGPFRDPPPADVDQTVAAPETDDR